MTPLPSLPTLPEAGAWRLKKWQESLFLFALPFLLYAESYGFGLLGLDDAEYYLHNTALHEGHAQGLLDIWRTTFLSDYFPISQLTLWLDLALFGNHAWWGARLHGLLWFGLGTLGVRSLVERISGRRGLAAAVALLYAVHPVCAQTTLWLAERKNMVSLAFTFWSVERYVFARGLPEAGRRRAWGLAAWALALAAMLAKVHAVVIPLLLLVYEALLGKGTWRKRTGALAPFIAASAIFLALNLAFVRRDLRGAFLGGSRIAALASDGPIVLGYVKHTFFPLELSFFYYVKELAPASPWGWGAWILLGLMGAGVVRTARRRRLVAFGWIFGLAALAPALNLAPAAAFMFDHWHHWALPGWLLALCVWVDDQLERARPERARCWKRVALAAAAFFFAALAFARVPAFTSDLRLFAHAARTEPDSAWAWAAYGRALKASGDPALRKQAGEAALRALRCPDAVRLLPQDRSAMLDFAAADLIKAGQKEKAWRLVDRGTRPERFRDPVHARLTRAEWAVRTDRPREAVALLEPEFQARYAAAARLLRQRCRSGERLPDALPPQLNIRLEGSDAFGKTVVRERVRKILFWLAGAYLKSGQPEKAFDAAALLVNEEPGYVPGRMLLAGACRALGMEKAGERLLKQTRKRASLQKGNGER